MDMEKAKSASNRYMIKYGVYDLQNLKYEDDQIFVTKITRPTNEINPFSIK